MLINISSWVGHWWFLIPAIPIGYWLYVKLMRKFAPGRMGWDFFALKAPIFGQLVEKNIVARTMRTLGTLVASGVPILEALHITRETSGNAAFEKMFGQVYDSIREGESIAKPMKENSFVLKNSGAMPALVFMGLMLFPIGLLIGTIIAVFVDFGFTVRHGGLVLRAVPDLRRRGGGADHAAASPTASATRSWTTWWSTWSTWARRRASWTRCCTRWPTRSTKKWPCSPKASRP